MTRRLCVSPATREAIHHNPRPKEYCPKHGPAYSAKGCEQCAYEKQHPKTNIDDIVGHLCRVTLEGRIERPHELGVVVRVYYQGAPEGTLMVLPWKAVTPLVEVKS